MIRRRACRLSISKLCFPRPSKSHGTGARPSHLLRQASAHAGQPGEQVLVLGKLDLELALGRARVEAEYVEDEPRAVYDPRVFPQGFFQVSLLPGGELVIEKDIGGIFRGHEPGDLLHLAGSDPCRCTRSGKFLPGLPRNGKSGGPGQAPELFEGILDGPGRFPPFQLDADEYCLVTRHGPECIRFRENAPIQIVMHYFTEVGENR